MIARRTSVILTSLLVAILATACSSSPSTPDAGASDNTDASESIDSSSGSIIEGPAVVRGTGELTGEGMPQLPLANCEKIVNTETSITAGNSLWAFELQCSTREPFDITSANLLSAGFELGFDMVLGDDSNVSDWKHFLTATEVGSLEVDVKVTGSDGDFNVKYIVTETPVN